MRIKIKKQTFSLTLPEEQLKTLSLQEQQTKFPFSNQTLRTAAFDDLQKWNTSKNVYSQFKSKDTLSSTASKPKRLHKKCPSNIIKKVSFIQQNSSFHNFKLNVTNKSLKKHSLIEAKKDKFVQLSNKKRDNMAISRNKDNLFDFSFKSTSNSEKIKTLKRFMQNQFKLLYSQRGYTQQKVPSKLILYPTDQIFNDFSVETKAYKSVQLNKTNSFKNKINIRGISSQRQEKKLQSKKIMKFKAFLEENKIPTK